MLVGRISLTEDVAGDGEVGYALARYLGGEVINLPHEFPTVEWGGENCKRAFYLYAIIDPLYILFFYRLYSEILILFLHLELDRHNSGYIR